MVCCERRQRGRTTAAPAPPAPPPHRPRRLPRSGDGQPGNGVQARESAGTTGTAGVRTGPRRRTGRRAAIAERRRGTGSRPGGRGCEPGAGRTGGGLPDRPDSDCEFADNPRAGAAAARPGSGGSTVHTLPAVRSDDRRRLGRVRLAGSGPAQRLADAATADGGMARLLAAVGTAQLLQSSALAAAAGAPDPAAGAPDPRPAAAHPAPGSCPAATASPSSAPVNNGGTAAGSMPSCRSLAALISTEQETMYGYQVALTRLDGAAAKSAAAAARTARDTSSPARNPRAGRSAHRSRRRSPATPWIRRSWPPPGPAWRRWRARRCPRTATSWPSATATPGSGPSRGCSAPPAAPLSGGQVPPRCRAWTWTPRRSSDAARRLTPGQGPAYLA